MSRSPKLAVSARPQRSGSIAVRERTNEHRAMTRPGRERMRHQPTGRPRSLLSFPKSELVAGMRQQVDPLGASRLGKPGRRGR
jgi:hypothetical protein